VTTLITAAKETIIFLDVVNNYTVIQHDVKQILDDFVVLAVSSQNCARKCAKSQVLLLPTASQSFFRPKLYQSFINNP